jgi:hypothetical protein
MRVNANIVMEKLMVYGISLFFVLSLLSFACAQDIALEYPEEIAYGKEFEVIVELMDFTEDEYDIKIDVTNSEGSRISEILNQGEWKSTHNYVRDAIDTSEKNESSFSLRIKEEYAGTAAIEVKTRDSTSQIEAFPGYEIEILGESQQQEESEDEQAEEEQEEEEEEYEIYLDMEWDDDNIINKEEFEIEVSAFDLESKIYDVKVYIIDEDEELISEIFDEEDAEWKSGNYYLRDFFRGPGDETETVTLRIDEEFDDFTGDAFIKTRIRVSGTTPIIAEEQYEIEILEQEDYEENYEEAEYQEIKYEKEEEQEEEESNSMIKLNGNAVKKQNEEKDTEEPEQAKILYESPNEKIKRYSIYGLNLLLVGIIIFLLINFKNNKNQG